MITASSLRLARCAIALCGIVAIVVMFGPAVRSTFQQDGHRNDFLSFYTGARLAASDVNPYDIGRTIELQRSLGWHSWQNTLPFIRLPFYVVLLRPLAGCEYLRAYALWQMLSGLAFVSGLALLARRFGGSAWVIGAWSVPFAACLLRGQDTAFLMLIAVIGGLLMERGAGFSAGLSLSLLLIKWPYLLFVPFVIVLRREWAVARGMIVGVGALLGISLFAVDFDWVHSYLSIVLAPQVTPNWQQMPNLTGLLASWPWARAISSAAVLCCVLWSAVALPAWAALHLSIFGALLMSPHTYVADCVMLIPLIMWAAVSADGYLRFTGFCAGIPVWYCLLLVPGTGVVAQLGLLAMLGVVSRHAMTFRMSYDAACQNAEALDPASPRSGAREVQSSRQPRKRL